MTEPVDFEALRKERNEKRAAAFERLRAEGWEVAGHCAHNADDACYCACSYGGPCEHVFSSWREFEDGSGSEAVCERCGMGAMSHSLHTCD